MGFSVVMVVNSVKKTGDTSSSNVTSESRKINDIPTVIGEYSEQSSDERNQWTSDSDTTEIIDDSESIDDTDDTYESDKEDLTEPKCFTIHLVKTSETDWMDYAEIEVKYGESFELPVPIRRGYAFLYWVDEKGHKYENGITYVCNFEEDLYLTPFFE